MDEAAFLTLRTGGQVWVVDRDEFPADGDAAAADEKNLAFVRALMDLCEGGSPDEQTAPTSE